MKPQEVAPPELQSPYPGGVRVWYAIGTMAAGWILAYLDRYVLGILIEPMRHALALSDTQLSLVQGFAFALFFVLAGLPIGRLVDRTNRRNILLLGVICWSVATFACGLAHNFWELFAARLAVGIGEACLAPASFSIVADLIPPKRRGLAMGMLVSGTGIGNALSIFAGGLILQAVGVEGVVKLPILGLVGAWQLVFFVVSAPGLLVALLLLLVREPVRREKVKSEAGAEARSFLKYVRRHPAGFGLTYAAIASSWLATIGSAAWIPVILMRIHHMSPAQLGATIGLSLLIVGGCSAPLGGALSDRLNRRFPDAGRLGPFLMIYPFQLLVYVVWWFRGDALSAILAFGLTGPLTGNMMAASMYPALNQLVPNELRGQNITLFMFFGNIIGMGLAPTAVALVTDQVFHDPLMVKQSVILVAAPALAMGFILALLALKPYRRICEASAAVMQA